MITCAALDVVIRGDLKPHVDSAEEWPLYFISSETK
jgi:hypothetical protein